MSLNNLTYFFEFTEPHPLSAAVNQREQREAKPVRHRLRLRIPKEYQQEPIVFYLVSLYGITVNINSAILGVSGNTDGCFDLELTGEPNAIDSALSYLSDLDVETWTGNTLIESTFLRSF